MVPARKLAGWVLVVFLGGCASLTTSPTTYDQRLFAAQGDFNTALRVVREYVKRPVCGQTRALQCADPGIVEDLKKFTREGADAFAMAKRWRNQTSLQRVLTATSQLTAYLIEKGVS